MRNELCGLHKHFLTCEPGANLTELRSCGVVVGTARVLSRRENDFVCRHCERSEAIHFRGARGGLLRRHAPRNDEAASRERFCLGPEAIRKHGPF